MRCLQDLGVRADDETLFIRSARDVTGFEGDVASYALCNRDNRNSGRDAYGKRRAAQGGPIWSCHSNLVHGAINIVAGKPELEPCNSALPKPGYRAIN